MALPGDLNTVTVTGTFLDPAGQAQRGWVSFTPSAILTDVTDSVVIAPLPRTCEVTGGTLTSPPLAATDNTLLLPGGWWYTVEISLQNAQPYSFAAFIAYANGATQDISTLAPLELQAAMASYLPLTGGTMTGPLYAQTPTSSSEVATMGYVNAVAEQLQAKSPVQLATTAALPTNTYSATDMTLTASYVGALTIDSTAAEAGWRVLVKNEATSANNGLYDVTSAGATLEPWQLTRTSDMDTGEQVPGAYTFVQQGPDNAETGWIVAGTGPYVIGTTAITWVPFAGAGASGVITSDALWPWQGDAVQRLAIPSYIYPTYYESGGGAWQTMQSAAPYVALLIINPDSGPGTSSNSDYVTQMGLAQASGARVIGYIPTSYTETTLATAQSQVDDYYAWYGVDGIFFDQVTTDAGNDQAYYQTLYAYVKAKPTGTRTVVINPGTIPDVSYMSACDIAVTAETDLGTYRTWSPPSWQADYPANRFWHIIYAVATTAQRDEMLALTRANRAGFVWITNGLEPDPYDTLPSDPYWSGMVSQIPLPLPVPAQAPVLEDGFANANAAICTQWEVFGGCTINGSQQLVVPSLYTYGDYVSSAASWNFTGRAATIEVASVPAAASGEFWMRVVQNSTNFVAIGTSGSNLVARICLSGTNSDTDVTYSGTSMAYWRITLSGGVVSWQTAPDGVTWAVQRTASTGLPTLTTATLVLVAGHYTSSDPNQSATVDSVLVL